MNFKGESDLVEAFYQGNLILNREIGTDDWFECDWDYPQFDLLRYEYKVADQ